MLLSQYFALHLKQEIHVVLLAVHDYTKNENRKMEDSENRIKNESVSFHHGGKVE